MKVTIIGGGIIGLCSAYYLAEQGAEIEVIDQTDFSEGCSFGNAGMVVPSHFIPLATPGVITKGIRWMFNPKSPFYIKPRMNLELAQWLWAFYRSCQPKKVEGAIPVLRDFGVLSKKLYQELASHPELNFDFAEQGLMMLFKTQKALKEEVETAAIANEIGIKALVLDADQIKKYETGILTDSIGGIFYPGDAHLYPNKLMHQLVVYLKNKGVAFRGNTKIKGFEKDKNQITALYNENGKVSVVGQKVLIAGGSWTPALLKSLGLKLLLQDGKGYSVTIKNASARPRIPSILTEAKVAITPMGKDLRIGGTLEISNLSNKINLKRVNAILEAVPKYYPSLQITPPTEQSVWYGFRPCTPDGLPYIGAFSQYKNLFLATGHAMMGLSLGPATGQLVAEMLLGQKTTLDLHPFSVSRF